MKLGANLEKDWISAMVSADASLRFTSCHFMSGSSPE